VKARFKKTTVTLTMVCKS